MKVGIATWFIIRGGKEAEGTVRVGRRLNGKGYMQGEGWEESVLWIWGDRGRLRGDYCEGS